MKEAVKDALYAKLHFSGQLQKIAAFSSRIQTFKKFGKLFAKLIFLKSIAEDCSISRI